MNYFSPLTLFIPISTLSFVILFSHLNIIYIHCDTKLHEKVVVGGNTLVLLS